MHIILYSRSAQDVPGTSRMSPGACMQVVKAVVEAHESGELGKALEEGEPGFKAWLKAMGKAQGRKGKRLFMPVRVALTGSMHVSIHGAQIDISLTAAGVSCSI